LIIVHAGSEKGCVLGAVLMFKSMARCGHYHNDMNDNIFSNWLYVTSQRNI
jgi:hypothetical protein